jgi:hypothetical protein
MKETMGRKMAFKRKTERQPDWVREGYHVGIKRCHGEVTCWSCEKRVHGLGVVLTREGGKYAMKPMIFFHSLCWRKEAGQRRRKAEAADKYIAMYKAVEEAGKRGATIMEVARLSQVNRRLVSRYLAEMVAVGKFAKEIKGRAARYAIRPS